MLMHNPQQSLRSKLGSSIRALNILVEMTLTKARCMIYELGQGVRAEKRQIDRGEEEKEEREDEKQGGCKGREGCKRRGKALINERCNSPFSEIIPSFDEWSHYKMLSCVLLNVITNLIDGTG